MILSKTKTIYFSTSRGRSYMSKDSAIKAEARALIKMRHPSEKAEFDELGRMTYSGFHWSSIPRSKVLLRRVCRLVKNANT